MNKVETSPFSNSLKRGISGSNVCVKSTQVACFKVFNCCYKGYCVIKSPVFSLLYDKCCDYSWRLALTAFTSTVNASLTSSSFRVFKPQSGFTQNNERSICCSERLIAVVISSFVGIRGL